MNLDQCEKLSGIVVSLVTVVAILIGGCFTLVEYHGYKKDKKQDTSLKLVSEYYSKDALAYREKLDAAWEVGHPVLISTLKVSSDKSLAYNSYVKALVREEKLSGNVDYVMDFYERLVTCVDASLCDKSIIDRFFLKSGGIFFRKYYPYVCSLRLKWRDESIWKKTEKYFNSNGAGEICSK